MEPVNVTQNKSGGSPRLLMPVAWGVWVFLAIMLAVGPVPDSKRWALLPVSLLLAVATTWPRKGSAPALPPQPVLEPNLQEQPTKRLDEEEEPRSPGAAPSQLELNAAQLRMQRIELLMQESRQAENEAKEQARRLWEVFHQLNHPAGFLDVEGVVLDLNASAVWLLQDEISHLRGKSLTELSVLGGQEVFEEPLSRAVTGETVQFQIEVPSEEAGPHILVMSLKPVLKNGNIDLLILEGHDITERIRAEEALQETFNQFQQSQKMEAIGRLAGGIAHDFNNLLTSILGFTNMALEQIPEGEGVVEDLDEVVKAANRAQNLTQKLLALSRKDVPDSQPIDLNQLLKGMDNLIRVTLHENLELVVDLDEEPAVIQVDPTSMEQVIINLAVNARDAMPRSGRLYISTRHTRVSTHHSYEEGLEPGEYIHLTVRDTGYGMESDVLEHAFEPFYTTKESGQGTGLGLSTVYAIIKQYQGVIRVHSEAGEGTEFQIFLPKVGQSEQMMLNLPQHSELSPLPTGTETILLVEDEEGVRRMASKMIQSLGYSLLIAEDGEKGVEVAQSHPGHIDLILTDVVMPNLSGPEMIDRLRLTMGYIPHLYVSGFTMDKLKEHGADGSEQNLIRKPYDRETLARRIRNTLDMEGGVRRDTAPSDS